MKSIEQSTISIDMFDKLVAFSFRNSGQLDQWPRNTVLTLEFESRSGVLLHMVCQGITSATLPTLSSSIQISAFTIEDLRESQLQGVKWRLYNAEQDNDFEVLCSKVLVSI